MSRHLHMLRRRLAPALRPFVQLGRWLLYLPRLVLRRPAGHFRYVFRPEEPPGPFRVNIHLGASARIPPAAAQTWLAQQTLDTLTVVRPGDLAAEDAAPFFLAPGDTLPDLPAAFLESAAYVLAAEHIDAVVLREGLDALPSDLAAGDVTSPALRPTTLFANRGWHFDAGANTVTPAKPHCLVKAIDHGGVSAPMPAPGRRRRGPYLSTRPLPPILEVGVRDVATFARPPAPRSGKPHVLVTLSYLARGGVETVLFETLRELKERFDFTLVTFAPHHPELGDRRADFREITERILCLGDLVHPAAMYGIVLSLLDHTGAEVLFNTNGTTFFYDIAPRLHHDRPHVRVIDQLYDHRAGYITWYTPEIQASVNACVAVNRHIAEALVERGLPSERAPVIWPCGRRREAFPRGEAAVRVRQELRRELGYRDDDIVFLTAARMNPQKRPLDLVRLAERLRDAPRAAFLVVGGGELEDDVDTAIAKALARHPGHPPRIRRLPFRDDIPRLVTACDVGCLVSAFEGLPVFMMECFQGGRTFLGTAVGEMGDVLRETGAGELVEQPGDLDALEAAARCLLNAEHRTVLVERAIEAAALFEVGVCAQRYGDLFAAPPRRSRGDG